MRTGANPDLARILTWPSSPRFGLTVEETREEDSDIIFVDRRPTDRTAPAAGGVAIGRFARRIRLCLAVSR